MYSRFSMPASTSTWCSALSSGELRDAIHELAHSPHMRSYVLEHAMLMLDLEQLGKLFDRAADHHEMLNPRGVRQIPHNPGP